MWLLSLVAAQTFYKDSLVYWSLRNFVQEILSVTMTTDSIGVLIKVFIWFPWPHELNWFLFNFIALHLFLSIFGSKHWIFIWFRYFTIATFRYFAMLLLQHLFQAGNCMFKVHNRNARTRCEISSKLTIKTPQRRHWRCSGVFIVNSEHISHLFLVFLLLNLSW